MALIEKDVVKHFMNLMNSEHTEIVDQAVWGIGNIAGDNVFTRDQVLSAGALDRIAVLLNNFPPETSLTRNATWTISNLCRGKPRADFKILQQAIGPLLKVIKENENPDILVDCCWALSYIIDGSKEVITEFMIPELIDRLIGLVNHNTLSIQIPVIRTLGNMTTGDDTQVQILLDRGLLQALCITLSH